MIRFVACALSCVAEVVLMLSAMGGNRVAAFLMVPWVAVMVFTLGGCIGACTEGKP